VTLQFFVEFCVDVIRSVYELSEDHCLLSSLLEDSILVKQFLQSAEFSVRVGMNVIEAPL